MDEDAPAGKLSRLEHQRSVGGEPSFRMEKLPEVTSVPPIPSFSSPEGERKSCLNITVSLKIQPS
jgi:hypothetical protein